MASLMDSGALIKEYTLTAHYRFMQNMAVRIKYRQDHVNKDIFVDEKELFDSQDTLAVEFYYRF